MSKPSKKQHRGRKKGRGTHQQKSDRVEVGKEALQATVTQLMSPGLFSAVLSRAPSKYRARLLSIEVMVLGLLDFVLNALPSFRAIVQRLRKGEVGALEKVDVSSDSSFYERLEKMDHSVFLSTLREVTQALKMRGGFKRRIIERLVPFATGVYAVDDTTLDKMMRKAKWLKEIPKGAMETLGGRLGCALDLSTGRIAEILYDPDSNANEKNHARPLIERLGAGALYVFDLGYFSFPFFDYLTEHYCYFVSRLRAKTSTQLIRVLAEGPHYRDSIVYLGKYRANQAAHPVRLVEVLIKGKWYSYVTNVCDPRMLPAEAVWALYAQRWHIEMAFAAIKRALGMAFLRTTHQNGLLIQIWSTLTVYQVLQDLRLEIANKNGWNDDDVSWTTLTRWVGWYGDRQRALPLRDWLIKGAKEMGLKKAGVRKRRLDQLPDEVLAECQAPPVPPGSEELVSRTARQGKPAPRTGPIAIVLGGLA